MTRCTLSGSTNTTAAPTFHWVSSELQSVIAGVGGSMVIVVVGVSANQIPLNGALEQEKPTLGSFEEVWKRFRRRCITSVCLSASERVHACVNASPPSHTLIHTVCDPCVLHVLPDSCSLPLIRVHKAVYCLCFHPVQFITECDESEMTTQNYFTFHVTPASDSNI